MSVSPLESIVKRARVWPWLVIAAWLALADQTVKWLVQDLMPYGQSVPLTSFFNWVHVWNTGAAFSLLAEAGGWQRYFFIALALTVSVALILMLSKPLPRLEAMGYSLFLGGAVGNVVDRIVRGYVVDYLDFHWHDWHWPAFNLADVGICLGAVLLLVTTFRGTRSSRVSAGR